MLDRHHAFTLTGEQKRRILNNENYLIIPEFRALVISSDPPGMKIRIIQILSDNFSTQHVCVSDHSDGREETG